MFASLVVLLLLLVVIPVPSHGQGVPACESLMAVIQHFAQGAAEDTTRLRMQLAEAKAQADQQRKRAETAEARLRALNPQTETPKDQTQ